MPLDQVVLLFVEGPPTTAFDAEKLDLPHSWSPYTWRDQRPLGLTEYYQKVLGVDRAAFFQTLEDAMIPMYGIGDWRAHRGYEPLQFFIPASGLADTIAKWNTLLSQEIPGLIMIRLQLEASEEGAKSSVNAALVAAEKARIRMASKSLLWITLPQDPAAPSYWSTKGTTASFESALRQKGEVFPDISKVITSALIN